MSTPVEAVFYDGVTSRPRSASVSVEPPETLVVDIPGEGREEPLRIRWPLEHKGMTWERTATTLRLAFGEHPRRVVLVRDPQFIRAFVLRMRYAGRQGLYDRSLQLVRRGPVLFLLGILAVLVAAYIWLLPWTAERLALVLPVSLDRKLGDTMYDALAPQLAVDSTRSVALQAFGDHLRLAPSHEVRYHVVDDDQINAFAMPGGHIVVFTGLLDRMTKPEELAALLAHEATHVEKRHSTRSVVRSLSGSVFLALLVGDVSGVVAVAARQADALRELGYSRALETEADTLGIHALSDNGVDPRGMVQLLELLQADAHDMPEAAKFLSSHPLTTERIATAQQVIGRVGDGKAEGPELRPLFEVLTRK
ncbi:MAG TPA: M48 family metallopeptidase [Flavobacteriales bacterium]